MTTDKLLAPADPASRWTSAHHGPAFYAYSTNYLIDLDNAVIMDVEASTAMRQGELPACKRMIARVQERFGIWPERLAADTASGSAEMLAWLVHERDIEPHIPVFDKSARRDDTFERGEFTYDHDDDSYVCPAGKRLRLRPRNRNFTTPRSEVDQDGFIRYRARQQDCTGCDLRQRCKPNMPARKIMRSIHEGARDLARDIATTDADVTSCRQRKKVEMLFAHLKRILKLDRLRLRGPNGAKNEFLLAATAQNLRKMAKLIPMPFRKGPWRGGLLPYVDFLFRCYSTPGERCGAWARDASWKRFEVPNKLYLGCTAHCPGSMIVRASVPCSSQRNASLI